VHFPPLQSVDLASRSLANIVFSIYVMPPHDEPLKFVVSCQAEITKMAPLQLTCSPISLSAPLRRNTGAPPASSQPHIADVRKTLQLALTEASAPSFSICRRVGLSAATENCPDGSAAICSRYVRSRSETSRRRKEQLHEEVRHIVRTVHAEGECPSVSRSDSPPPEHSIQRLGAISASVKAGRQELGQMHPS